MHNVIQEEAFKQFLAEHRDSTVRQLSAELNRYFTNPTITTSHLTTEPIFRMHDFMAQVQYMLFSRIVSCAYGEVHGVPYQLADSMLSSLDSLDRGSLLIALWGAMKHDEWCKLFMESWTRIETADFMSDDLAEVIAQVSPSELQAFMEEESRAAWDSLPEQFTVYRGCMNGGENGFSWTTDKDVALKFCSRKVSSFSGGMKFRLLLSTVSYATTQQIQSLKPRPVELLTGTVNKKDCVMFVGRGEAEVFSSCVSITDKELFVETAED